MTETGDWVGDWSARRATLSPDADALTDATTGETWTYADLDARANRTARLLDEFGVADGERVAVVSRNRPELVDLLFACGRRVASSRRCPTGWHRRSSRNCSTR